MIVVVGISAVLIHLIFKTPFISTTLLISLGYVIGVSKKKGK